MNYKRLLKKITHKEYMGGTFGYNGCSVNVTLGGDSIDVHIEDRSGIRAEFDFTFEIPRSIVFYDTNRKTANCISRNLNALYCTNIPVFHE